MSNNLTFYERQKLEFWFSKTKQSIRAIAVIMRRDHTVLTRELKRNGRGDRKRYRADVAQRIFEQRTHKQHRGKLDRYPELKEYVVSGLKNEWSPDVIAGKLKTDGAKQTISHESIYHYIYNKDGRFEGWYQYLRQGKKRRQKRYGRKACKLRIPERKSIQTRPGYVDGRERYGDWESDSLIFSKQRTAISVQSERKSKLIRMHKIANKTAEETANALIRTIESLPDELFRTITFDNGTENVKHTEIKKSMPLRHTFAIPLLPGRKAGWKTPTSSSDNTCPETLTCLN